MVRRCCYCLSKQIHDPLRTSPRFLTAVVVRLHDPYCFRYHPPFHSRGARVTIIHVLAGKKRVHEQGNNMKSRREQYIDWTRVNWKCHVTVFWWVALTRRWFPGDGAKSPRSGSSLWREDGFGETCSWERSHSVLMARFGEKVVFGSRV